MKSVLFTRVHNRVLMCVRHGNPCMLKRECPPQSHIQLVQSTGQSFSNVCGFKDNNVRLFTFSLPCTFNTTLNITRSCKHYAALKDSRMTEFSPATHELYLKSI